MPLRAANRISARAANRISPGRSGVVLEGARAGGCSPERGMAVSTDGRDLWILSGRNSGKTLGRCATFPYTPIRSPISPPQGFTATPSKIARRERPASIAYYR